MSKVLIPWVNDPVNAGNYLRQAQVASFEADRLATAARLLVEALVERQINEEDLTCAQQALQQGDQTFDRAILSRITVAGIDVAGMPAVFPNLDALYAAIDESNCMHPSNGVAT